MELAPHEFSGLLYARDTSAGELIAVASDVASSVGDQGFDPPALT